MNKTKAFNGKKEKAHIVCKKYLQNKRDFLKFYAEMPIILTESVKKKTVSDLKDCQEQDKNW